MTLLSINVAIFLFMLVLNLSRPGMDNLIIFYGGISRRNLSNGLIYTVLSALFLHGNLWHILFNMFALYHIGRIVEAIYGSNRFLLFYLLTGVAGNLAAVAFAPSYITITIGSSSAIFGLVGMLFTIGFRKDTPMMLRGVTGASLLPIILLNLFLGFTIPNISNSAHIGGLLAGAAIGWFAKPRYSQRPRRSVPRRVKQKTPEEVGQEVLLKYVPMLNALKEKGTQDTIDERTILIARLRSELSELKDTELASKILWRVFEKDLISSEEFERLRKFI
ncbi:MAG TPA: DUF1751 domain-containing protein [Kosmotogaceae bacterium]|nr:MAG: Rhomboid family protein [Thermotogales bacterium 46_20]HAA85975.1 DUF1751 domain-containing protein [Kosmotogaceae bacterium]